MSNLAELVSAQLAPIEERVRPQGGKIVRCVIPRVMRDFIQQDSAITLSGKDSLTYHELSATLPQLYDSSYVLEETLADLAGSPVDLEELRLTLYQGGNKAYIIFNEARLANSSDRYHFITTFLEEKLIQNMVEKLRQIFIISNLLLNGLLNFIHVKLYKL